MHRSHAKAERDLLHRRLVNMKVQDGGTVVDNDTGVRFLNYNFCGKKTMVEVLIPILREHLE